MPTFEEGSHQYHPTLSGGTFLIPMSNASGPPKSPEFPPHPILLVFTLLWFRQSALDYSLPLANTNHRENGYYWVSALCLHFNEPPVNNVPIHNKDSNDRNSRCLSGWWKWYFWVGQSFDVPLSHTSGGLLVSLFLGSTSSTGKCFWLFFY